jgi:proteasome lid subunit RPN8/RPN11
MVMTMLRPLLELPRSLYADLITDLARSGAGVAESGAFLLGTQDGEERQVSGYLPYEAVAAQSRRRHAYVAFTAQEMARAWDYCYQHKVQVVADVHTHPGGPVQSLSDRAHPIVSVQGHVALIVPYFALCNPQPQDLGVHQFLGGGRWRSLFGDDAARALQFT